MVNIKNVYWMLAYAFDMLKEKGTQSIKTEEFNNIYDLLAAILLKSFNYQIKKGLNKEYLLYCETLTNVKGKILVSDSIKYNTIKNHKLICEHDEFSANSYMNQIIKTTMIYLIKNDKLKDKYKKGKKKIILLLKDVDEISVTNINWKNVKYNRNNITYKMILNVCYLIIEGLLLTTEKGENELTKFIDETRMSTLYERFVKEYYRKHFPALKAKALHIDWNIGDNEVIGLLPDMKTDITLTYKEKTLIIDTKYYKKTLQNNTMFNKRTIINGHIYQIFTYVKNKDKSNNGNVSGMLLYAKTDEDTLPNQKNTFGNNVITIKTLDLTKDFETVMKQLDDIAYEFSNYEIKKK